MVNDDEGYAYGDMHKLVLQGIMSAGFLDAKGVKNLFFGACKHLKLDTEQRTSMPEIQKVVREINERIKPFDMAIRSASCELTGKKFYVFLITVEKPIMKLQTLFSKAELELFQKIMTAALRNYSNFAVPVTDCLNMAREIDARNFTIEMAEGFIQKMISLQYLAKYIVEVKNQKYEVTIGIRAIREFEGILREVYDDVMTNCHLCKMIMLHGYQCPKCNIFVHKACFTKYLSTMKTCPGCKTSWKEKEMVKRIRQDETQEKSQSYSSFNTASTSRGGSRRMHTDTPQEMPFLEPMVSPKGKSKGKNTPATVKSSPRGSRGKRKSVARLSSSEESD